jgi:hypothetical protein
LGSQLALVQTEPAFGTAGARRWRNDTKYQIDLMRPGQQSKRSRGRNNRKSSNPLSRTYESNGPDVKVRGNASHIADKYVQLARDATASGDLIMAENYFQHAEHYFRVISAAQAQFQQQRADQPSGDDRSEAGDGGGDGQARSGERMNGEAHDTRATAPDTRAAAPDPAGADKADGKDAAEGSPAGGARKPRRRNARADAPADPNLASAPQPSINGSSGEDAGTSTDTTPAEDETAAAK